MATTKEYVDFCVEQLPTHYDIRYRKMFGEYMIYLNDKPVFLVCDNTVFVKKIPELAAIMEDASENYPYDGAKLHYVLDVEDRELTERVAEILECVTPVPKKKK